jgi:hypothetical protein
MSAAIVFAKGQLEIKAGKDRCVIRGLFPSPHGAQDAAGMRRSGNI